MRLDRKIDCITAGKHTWSATGGGYWCMKCHLMVGDKIIMHMRHNGMNDLEGILQTAAEDSTKWVQDLHFWTQYASDL